MEQERPPTPLQCPRCYSMDTKFRYFNNNNRTQPRHYCRACKRLWTVGGILRDVSCRKKPKQTRASSSGCGNMPLLPQHLLSSGEQVLFPQFPTPMAVMVPQNCDTAMIPPVMNLPEPISSLSSFYLNEETGRFDAIQSMIEPGAMNQPVTVGNQFGGGTAEIAFMQDLHTPSMASQQVLQQQIPGFIEPYQFHDQANIEAAHNLSNHSLVQPAWPTTYLPQNEPNNFNFSAPNTYLWNNYGGNTTNTDAPSTSANPNLWPNFPSYGPQ